jgi:hypothetical protein
MNPDTPTVRRTRSPSYPAVSLPDGLEDLRRIFSQIQHHPAPLEAMGAALDMKPGGSALNGRLSALKKFGLLDEIEGTKGANKSYKVTRLGKDLVLQNPTSEEFSAAARQAALLPVIYAALWNHFGPVLPANALLKTHLVRERNFNAHQVDGAIADFRATVDFAGLTGKNEEPPPGDIAPEAETTAQPTQRFVSMRTVTGAHVMPAAIASPGEVFTIPLEDGKVATIPYPMSEETWELFMQTLTLWKPRLVAAAEGTSEG